MKYKVGDKVKIVKNVTSHEFNNGEEIEIVEIHKKGYPPYKCRGIDREDEIWWVCEEEMAPLKYTWEDFLKAPIGTKVTFESGEVLVKTFDDTFANEGRYRCYAQLTSFETLINDKVEKIIKIEEPTYTTVYEPTEQVEEMTLEEVCKELGREIKIVKEK